MKKHISNIREKAGRHKTIIQNFSYLSLIQVFNLLVPLLAYPYLIRVLGTEKYGLVIFAQATVTYLVIIVSFGFNISATREISIYRDSKEKLSEIVSSVLIIKGFLFFSCFLLLVILLLLIPKAHGYEALFILSTWACLYEVIFPVWYFQGIEQMKYITYTSLISRIIFLGLIVVYIHRPEDYLRVPIFYGIGAFIAGSIALYLVFKKHHVEFYWQPRTILKRYFVDSLPIFMSNLAISLFISSNKVLIGTFVGMKEVSYYDLAEKITNFIKIPQSILSQALFPSLSKKFNLKPILKLFKITLGIFISVTLILIIYSKSLVLLLGGVKLLPAIIVLRILVCSVPFVVISNFLGIQILLPLGMNKSYTSSILTGSAIYFISVSFLWMVGKITLLSLPTLTLSIEFMIAGLMFYFYLRDVYPTLSKFT